MGDIVTSCVAIDTPCRRCGYSLFGQPTGGRCPECGETVAASTGNGVLARCDRRWIAGRARAMRAVFWGTVAYAGVGAAEQFIPVPSTATVADIIHRGQAQFAIESAVVLTLVAAHWWVASPAPGDGRSVRRVYRGGLAMVVVGQMIQLAMICRAPLHERWVEVGRAAGWAALAGSYVAWVGFVATIGRHAGRVPSDRLARAARRLGWATATGLPVLLAAAVLFGRLPPGRPLNPVVLVCALAMVVGMYASAIAAMVLLARVRPRFVSAAQGAKCGCW